MDKRKRKMKTVIRKAKSNVHITPNEVYETIDKLKIGRFPFFDPCPVNYTKNGLEIKWEKWNFINPPYDLTLEFVIKAFMELIFNNNKSVMLLPVKTDQLFFRMLHDVEKYYFDHRLKFGNKNNMGNPSFQTHFLTVIE